MTGIDEPFASYRRTIIEIQIPRGGTILTSPGEPPPVELESVLPLFVITAWNPGEERSPSEVNRAAQRDLVLLLTQSYPSRSLQLFPAVGRSPDGAHSEESVAVYGLQRCEAVALARRMRQAAIFEVSTAGTQVIDCRPRVCSESNTPTEDRAVAKPSNAYVWILLDVGIAPPLRRLSALLEDIEAAYRLDQHGFELTDQGGPGGSEQAAVDHAPPDVVLLRFGSLLRILLELSWRAWELKGRQFVGAVVTVLGPPEANPDGFDRVSKEFATASSRKPAMRQWVEAVQHRNVGIVLKELSTSRLIEGAKAHGARE